jgi:chemotaxis protein histidine kinase CheA
MDARALTETLRLELLETLRTELPYAIGLCETLNDLSSDTSETLSFLFRFAQSTRNSTLPLGLRDLAQLSAKLEELLSILRGFPSFLKPSQLGPLRGALIAMQERVLQLYSGDPSPWSNEESLQRIGETIHSLENELELKELPGPIAFPPGPRVAKPITSQLVRLDEEALAKLWVARSSIQDPEIKKLITTLCTQEVHVLVDRLKTQTSELSVRYKKPAKLLLQTTDFRYPRHLEAVLSNCLIKLTQSGVEQELETPSERRAFGKSECATFRISFAIQADRLEVTFQDDGRGPDASSPIPRSGWNQIKEFVRSFGGECAIRGIPGKGSERRIAFPLSPIFQQKTEKKAS